LVRENEKDIVLAAVMSLVSQKTSVPDVVVHVHVPLLETAELLKGTNGRLLFVGVVLPMRPMIVMAGRPPGCSVDVALHVESSETDGVSWMVMSLDEHGHGLLWLAVARFQVKGMIIRGAVALPGAGLV